MYCNNIFTHKIKINVFLPEILCIVVLIVENGDLTAFWPGGSQWVTADGYSFYVTVNVHE